jgi:alkylated DNA repair dioxygenase AlkB
MTRPGPPLSHVAAWNDTGAQQQQQQQQQQVLLRKRTYDGTTQKWSPWNAILTRRSRSVGSEDSFTPDAEPFVYNFTRGGGRLVVHANLLSTSRQRVVTEELMQCRHFRQYRIQGSPEPRAHFLLHEQATYDFEGEPQPGYRYGGIRMKSRPLHEMPEILELSADVQSLYHDHPAAAVAVASEGCFWNVGVNPVLYRDGRDRMGYHADDDQEEELILTVLVNSPLRATRRISIRPAHFKTKGNQDGDEELQLMLDAGDAYSMDGM